MQLIVASKAFSQLPLTSTPILLGVLALLTGCISDERTFLDTKPSVRFVSSLTPEAMKDCIIQDELENSNLRVTPFQGGWRIGFDVQQTPSLSQWFVEIDPVSGGSRVTGWGITGLFDSPSIERLHRHTDRCMQP